MKITAVYSDEILRYVKKLPNSTETRQFGRVMDCWEWTPGNQNVFDYYGHGLNITFMVAVKALPSLPNQTPWKITKSIADKMFEIQRSVMPPGTPDLIVAKTLSHMCGGNIAFTNNIGIGENYGNRIDPWLPDNNITGQKEPIGVLPVQGVGSVVEIIGEAWVNGNKDNDCYVIRAFDAENPGRFLNCTYEGNEHLFVKATTIARVLELPHGQRLGPFPQAGLPVNRDPNGPYTKVLLPLMANGSTNGMGDGWCKLFIPKYIIDVLPMGTLAKDVYPYYTPE